MLALGDSLTVGYGAAPQSAYPAVLSRLTGWHVVNGGVSGDTSAGAAARLPRLLTLNTKLVLVSIGGNDFLHHVPTQQTLASLRTIFQTLKNQNVSAVLIAQPHPSTGALLGHLDDAPVYETIAKEFQVPLFSRAWSDILEDKSLKSDLIHANNQGYAVFTEKLFEFLKKDVVNSP